MTKIQKGMWSASKHSIPTRSGCDFFTEANDKLRKEQANNNSDLFS